MQKNLTCKSLKDAKKNMYWYGIAFIPINFIFLLLGAMLLLLAAQNNITLPVLSDEILPMFASSYLGKSVLIIFVVGIIAAAFSSADSALAAITTSFSVDILGVQHKDEKSAIRYRQIIHICISVLFVFIIVGFKSLNNKSVIDAIYIIVSYTYGPLLGMYFFGLFTKLKANDNYVPFIALASPLICYFLNFICLKYFYFSFGYELLIINGLITFTGMWITKSPKYISKLT